MSKYQLSAAIVLWMLGSIVHASDFGCKVLLCLANPASNGGPKGIAECVDPINQLFRDLARGNPFPTCDISEGNDGSSYARLVSDPYDLCPAGYQHAPKGSYVVQGKISAKAQTNVTVIGSSASNKFEIQGEAKISEATDGLNPPMACVGNLIGTYPILAIDGNSTVYVYDKVVWQKPQSPSTPPFLN